MLNREELLNAMRLKTERVKIAGGEVIVSEIGAADYIKLWTEYQVDGKVDMTTFTPALVAFSVVDESGARVFSDEEVALLARSSHGPFMEIAAVARRLNGLAGDEVKKSVPSRAERSSSASA